MPTFTLLGLPFDLAVTLGIFATFLLLNYTIARHRVATILIAIYVAGGIAALSPVVEYLDSVLPFDARYIPAVVFLVLCAVVLFVLRSNRFFDPYMIPSGWELGLFAVLHTVVLVSIGVGLLPAAVTSEFSVNFLRVFGDGTVRSVLLFAPFVVLFFVRGND